ncbi:SF3 helicase domain-containing protein [Trichonephila inaurata madagascariensis]|uniref:SF3 helicase domain-containing protein n=1 Tax=Trichonephila inaurata madagascariensis TaxID=2747483 RepID=A0A8X6YCU6_9ARAC|nr:SF3 helicase domain-containing protein [Trichonephila inaurata madagascariensis]
MTDLRSAVRQFLKSTKNNMTPEKDLILKFEEFSEYQRRYDFQLGQYNSILDQACDTLTLENSSLQEEGLKRSFPKWRDPVKNHVNPRIRLWCITKMSLFGIYVKWEMKIKEYGSPTGIL